MYPTTSNLLLNKAQINVRNPKLRVYKNKNLKNLEGISRNKYNTLNTIDIQYNYITIRVHL